MTTLKPLKMITGPISYYHFTFNALNNTYKEFHFFGDQHETKLNDCQKLYSVPCSTPEQQVDSECQSIVLLLENMARFCFNNNFGCDLFLEVGFDLGNVPRNKRQMDEYFSDLYNYFLPALYKNKTSLSKNSNIKVHYSDIRRDENWQNLDPFAILYHSLNAFEMNDPSIDKKILNRTKRRYLGFIIQKLIETTILNAFQSEDYEKRIYDVIMELQSELQNSASDTTIYTQQYAVILTQLIETFKNTISASKERKNEQTGLMKRVNFFRAEIDKLRKLNYYIDNKNLADMLEDYIIKKLDKIYIDTKNDTEKIRNATGISDEDKNESETKIVQIMLLFFATAVMDGYALARMFYILELNKPQIIANFCGHTHISHYVDFFENVLKLKPIVRMDPVLASNGESKRCIQDENFQKIFPYASPYVIPIDVDKPNVGQIIQEQIQHHPTLPPSIPIPNPQDNPELFEKKRPQNVLSRSYKKTLTSPKKRKLNK